MLNNMTSEMDRWFSDEAMRLAVACDAMIKWEKKRLDQLLNTCSSLKIHPQMVTAETDFIRCTVSSPISLQKLHEEVSKDYPNFFPLFQLALTLPTGPATSDRSFSAMRRIRNSDFKAVTWEGRGYLCQLEKKALSVVLGKPLFAYTPVATL